MRGGPKILQALAPLVREYAAGRGKEAGRKVAVLGAAGGIGQSLSLLMKVRGCGALRAAVAGPPGI